MATNNNLNTYIVPTSTNEVTMPSQVAFFARLATTDSNVTGDGTAFTFGSGNALTEIYDQNSDFNTNGTFTAPVTGRYDLVVSNQIEDTGAATTYLIEIITSNRTYIVANVGPQGIAYSAGADITLVHSAVLADMDAADTATVQITVSGTGKTVDIRASTVGTFFQGTLIC